MSQGQKDFAFKCIEWGRAHKDTFYFTIAGDTLDLGETLAAIPWMESSLGVDTNHGEGHSKGPWGISGTTANGVYASKDDRARFGLSRTAPMGFETDIRLAAAIWLKGMGYIQQWHANRKRSITDREAWQLAAQVYRDGTNWQRRKEYGRVFRQRVAFLKIVARQRELEKRMRRK